MSQGTAFHDTSSGTSPSYDFVARAKNVMPAANPTFAGIPLAPQTAALAPGYVPDKAPGLSRTQKLLVGVPMVAVTAVLAAFIGSVGLHAFEDHQRAARIAATHVTLPSSIAGMARRASAQPQADRLINAVPTPTPPQGATYVATKSQLGSVFIGAFAMGDAEQRDYLVSARDAAKTLGFPLVKVDSGRLGGQMWCGADARKAQTFCAFTDDAVFGAMTVSGVGGQGLTTAHAFRTGVERRS